MPRRRVLIALSAAVAAAACAPCTPAVERVSLVPGPNPFGPGDPLWGPQPHRDHPAAVAVSIDGRKLYVALQGVEDEPGGEVAVVDLDTGTVARRIRVGSSPTGLALHPHGLFLAVTNRYSNFVSIVDTRRDEVAAEIPVPFYTIEVAFAPDGRRTWLTNRWKDSLLRWDVEAGASFRVVADNYSGVPADLPAGIAVGQNPRDLAVSPDGRRVYVGAIAGMSLSVVDAESQVEVRRVHLNSPVGGVAAAGPWVFATHTGAGTQHPPEEGEDTDGDGRPGDGTANVMFQDLQNEIAVLDADGTLVHGYTSDSLCCHDFRDVDPDRPNRGLLLPAPDTWTRSRVAFLPPREEWIVGGSLPERVAVAGDRLYAVFSGSNEVQSFRIGGDGRLTPGEAASGLYRTGMNPNAIAFSPDGRQAYVAERLGEYVTVLDLSAGPGHERRILVGDVTAGEFPATDAEIGEAVNFVTSGFTVDGDQTCVHCHREGANVAKPVAMPLQSDPVWGTRMQMAYRGAADTRPWFMETAMDETNFFPVINEFARKENFCCEGLDPLVWGSYPAADACLKSPGMPGCNHVLDCTRDPPPECASRPYGSRHLRRNEHFLDAARRLLGRDRTFGDALYRETLGPDGATVRQGLPLDFNGVTRSLGLFLLQRPRLLPNPNAQLDLPGARRGRALYESPGTGCASCHPLPTTAVARDFNPRSLPLRFPPLITPRRNPRNEDVDRISAGFVQSFPTTEQDAAGVRFGVPQLRGLWDRADRFLHDGRARSLAEAIATPGHPALRPGERGFNETSGMPDTHGGTSHLSAEEMEDLIAFILSL